jgi:hypothetical protein
MRHVFATLREWFARMVAHARPQRWGLAVAVAALVANIALLRVEADPRPMSDGIYSWLYARSLAFDHDIDFTNDYALCGDKFHHDKDRGGGHPDNPFYVGPSIFWVPVIELARVFHRFPPDTSEAVRSGCSGPIVTTGLRVGALLGALLVWLSYRAARRFADDYAAAVAGGLFAFGTTLSAYATGTYVASYSHVYDGTCVAALVLLSLRAFEEPRRLLRWGLAGAALAACVLHRPTNLPLGLIPAAYCVLALRAQRARLAAALSVLAGTTLALGVVPQLLIYRYLYGRMFGVVPQGQYFMQPWHPHVWLLLFAPKGLFLLAPVAWVSVAGAVLAFRRDVARTRLLVILGAFLIELYLASIPLDWDARSTIGARRLLPMIPLLVVLATVAVARVVAWFEARASRVRVLVTGLVLAPLAFVFLGESVWFSEPEHYFDYYPSQQAIYGDAFAASWRVIDERIGVLAVLPAQLVFSLRYGLPHEAYWKATHLYWYLRDHQTMRFERARLELKDKGLRAGMTGFAQGDDGVQLVQPRGTLVFCAEWPYATHLVVVASSARPASLRVSSRSFFGVSQRYGTISLGPSETTTRLTIPRGSFDSGVIELVFEGDAAAETHVRSVELVDKGVYAPVR